MQKNKSVREQAINEQKKEKIVMGQIGVMNAENKLNNI